MGTFTPPCKRPHRHSAQPSVADYLVTDFGSARPEPGLTAIMLPRPCRASYISGCSLNGSLRLSGPSRRTTPGCGSARGRCDSVSFATGGRGAISCGCVPTGPPASPSLAGDHWRRPTDSLKGTSPGWSSSFYGKPCGRADHVSGTEILFRGERVRVELGGDGE